MCESPKKRERDRHKNSDAQPQRQRPVYTVTVDSDTQLPSENISNLLDVHGQGSKSNCVMNVDASAIIVHPTVNNVVLAMEVDTGSAVSMIPVHVYESQFVSSSVATKCFAVSQVNQSHVKACLGCMYSTRQTV